MQDKENAAIACEVKISVTSGSYDEIQRLIERLREACTGDYKLEVNFNGQFFKAEDYVPFDSRMEQLIDKKLDERDRKFAQRFEKDNDPNFYIELFQELRKVIDGSGSTQP